VRLLPKIACPFPRSKPLSKQKEITEESHTHADEQTKFIEGKSRKSAGLEGLQIEVVGKCQRQQSDGNLQAYPGERRCDAQKK